MRQGSGARADDVDARVRAFFALPIAEPQRALLLGEMARLREQTWAKDVRWVREEGLHVTLRFLGEIPRADIEPLALRVGNEIAAIPAFEMSLQSIQLFPSPRRPRVVGVMLAESEPLCALASRIETAVVAHGLDAEPRAFRGHVTLGRLRNRARRPAKLCDELALTPARADHVVLLGSVLSRGGARYTELARLPLADAETQTS
jgi:2'-5' RNA ligase